VVGTERVAKPPLDYNGDGTDFAQFGASFGHTL
jgi:hypothetical protein